MKNPPAPIAAHYLLGKTTIAAALRIERPDGIVYGFTSHHKSVEFDGVAYSSTPGFDATSIELTASLAVGNGRLSTIDDQTVFLTKDIFNGLWRNSKFFLFRYNWASPTDGIDRSLNGFFGEIKINRNIVEAEILDLRQLLQAQRGSCIVKNCRTRLGSALCGIVLNSSPAVFIKEGVITSVTSGQVFRDSSRTEAVDWYRNGELEFLDGENEGARRRVSEYAADGSFTLSQKVFGTVQVGDRYRATAGCEKRYTEDCIGKYNNSINFQGTPHARGIDSLTTAPPVEV